MFCDIHPSEPSNFYLEVAQTGDCYYFCLLIELQVLLNWCQIQGKLVPCGHDDKFPMWFTYIHENSLDIIRKMV